MTRKLLRGPQVFSVSLQQLFASRLAVFLCIVISLGIFFRFVNIDRKVYWYDETRTSIRAVAAYPPTAVRDIFDNRITDINDLQSYQTVDPARGILSSLTVMAQDDPKHSPLYYLLVGLWARWVGDSVGVLRTLSAIIGLLCFPCLYWLCWELFRSPLIGWVAIALFAVSPYHILYAQEAREYALWTLAIILSSAMFLSAIRVQSIQRWIGYAFTVGFGVYCHTLFGLIVITHALYVAFDGASGEVWGTLKQGLEGAKSRLIKLGIPYLLATFVGLCSFLPWARLIFQKRNGLRLEHLEKQTGVLYVLKHWLFGVSAIFWDPNGAALIDIGQGTDTPLFYLTRALILGLIGYSIYYLVRTAPNRGKGFVLLLTGVGLLTLLIPDLILGGQRSTILRYIIPGYLGVQLAVAYLLATRGLTTDFSGRRFWRCVIVLIFSAGIVSSTISSQAATWWNKYNSYYNSQVADIVNQSSDPLLISDYSWYNSTQLLSLSHLLSSNVDLQLLAASDASQVAGSFDGQHQVFLYHPSDEFQSDLMEAGFHLEAVHPPGHLWRLEALADAMTNSDSSTNSLK